MKSVLEHAKNSESDHSLRENGFPERTSVLEELDRILSSRHFKSADRCKQFLRYVVLSKLDGHPERLKERTIGTEIFQRPPGYATGEDPVVRVQAGEVRRRLARCYQDAPGGSPLRIELPTGSYCPVFHWGSEPQVAGSHARSSKTAAAASSSRRPSLKTVTLAAVAVLAVAGAIGVMHPLFRVANAQSTIEQFWGPALASHQPILIFLANASAQPSTENTQSSVQARPVSSPTGARSIDASLPLGMTGNTTADDYSPSPEIVPAADASVAVALSGLFGKLNRQTQLRIGAAATYEELRNFPAAIIGGFDSKWTMQLVSNLHFAFLGGHGQYTIREQVPGGRVWTTRFGPHGDTVEDFAIVGRLIDSKTGQFTVTVAGIGPRGTEAAGDFVSSPRYLQEGLTGAPADWPNRNLEVLLQTTVTDSVAGPPRVIGVCAW